MLYSERPGAAVGLWADHTDVSSQIDVAMGNAGIDEDLGGTVSGVFLAKPTKIDFHARPGQPDVVALQIHMGPADFVQQRAQFILIWNARCIEVPGAAQDA